MKRFHMARHWFWLAPVVFGLVFIAGGVYMMQQGRDARNEVKDAIVSENIITSEDASIPNVLVDDADTAKAQSSAIKEHTLKITGGETYATLDRYVSADGKGTTSNGAEALIVQGNPVPNPARNTAFQAAALRTSLNVAVMGFKVSDLVVGLGAFLVVMGIMNILFLAPTVYYAAEIANERDDAKTPTTEGITGRPAPQA